MRCPICGLQSQTTNIIFPTHTSFTYNANGDLVYYTDIIYVPPGYWVTKRYEWDRRLK